MRKSSEQESGNHLVGFCFYARVFVIDNDCSV